MRLRPASRGSRPLRRVSHALFLDGQEFVAFLGIADHLGFFPSAEMAFSTSGRIEPAVTGWVENRREIVRGARQVLDRFEERNGLGNLDGHFLAG